MSDWFDKKGKVARPDDFYRSLLKDSPKKEDPSRREDKLGDMNKVEYEIVGVECKRILSSLAVLKDESIMLGGALGRIKKRQTELKARLEDTSKSQNAERISLEAHLDTIIKGFQEAIDKNEGAIQQAGPEFDAKRELENERARLEQGVNAEIAEMRLFLADLEKEKVIETHQLTENIAKEIEQTKTALQDLKKEQLETTRRLTVLQNNQLTDELEYQSKQTEKLLSKNGKLEETVAALKRDVEIHKKVELELASKSQKAQNEINTLSKRVKDAEKAKEELVQEHRRSVEEYTSQNNEELDERVFGLEKLLSELHKFQVEANKKKDKLEGECLKLASKVRSLRGNEHPVMTVLHESISLFQKRAGIGGGLYTNREDSEATDELVRERIDYFTKELPNIEHM